MVISGLIECTTCSSSQYSSTRQNVQDRQAVSAPSVVFDTFTLNAYCLLRVIQLLMVIRSQKTMNLLCIETRGRCLSLSLSL